jgi:tartrate dehydratase alpha subunit/fumarate hydratase class I-like protein
MMTGRIDEPYTTQEFTSEQGPQTHGEVKTVLRLLRGITQETMVLARQEVQLAKAEMTEKARTYARNSAYAAGGGAVLYAALLCLLAAAVGGLAVALTLVVAWYHALWISALIVGVVVGAIGYGMVAKAKKTFKETSVKPEQTSQTLRENQQWLHEKTRQAA